MKKYLMITAVLLATPTHADAKAFTTRSEVVDERKAREADEYQRDIDNTRFNGESVEELKKNNSLLTEQNKKLDALLESSEKNNELMQELLDRTR